MLTVQNLTLSRGDRVLVRDLNLELRPGEALALEGANGVGKTTLLRAIAGFVRPDRGEIRLAGQVVEPSERGAHLHWLGHLDGLKGHRRVADELAFQAAWLGGETPHITPAAEQLGLSPLMMLEVRRLSAGQRRRLALARFLAAPRPLWLLDEPLAPLDAHWRQIVGQLMQDHLASGGSVLAAVHDPLPVPARAMRLAGPVADAGVRSC